MMSPRKAGWLYIYKSKNMIDHISRIKDRGLTISSYMTAFITFF